MTYLPLILRRAACLAAALVPLAGCGGTREPAPTSTANGKLARLGTQTTEGSLPSAIGEPAADSRASNATPPIAPEESTRDAASAATRRPSSTSPRRGLSDLAEQARGRDFAGASVTLPAEDPTLPAIDSERVAAFGIRKVAGQHLTLYTDLPPHPAIDELPRVFDLAVPQWASYFEIDPGQVAPWRQVGYLVQDKERFQRAGLWPANLPPFLHGFQRGSELWLYEQPSDYYRRHLLLHEGTHAFMKRFLGGAGPPWYMEGTAELLATHRWHDGALTLRWFPTDKELTAYWGRIKIIQDDVAAGRGRSLLEILQYSNTAHLEVEPYAWCWAAAVFFDSHPAYRDRFRALKKLAPDTTLVFSERFHDLLLPEAPRVAREWQTFATNLDYGYDFERELIEVKPVQPLPAEGAEVTIAADRGWQSAGYLLETGGTYQIEATGRYQVGNQPKPWWCEPNGVTIRYHRGAPLGILLGAIVNEEAAVDGPTSLTRPDVIGSGGSANIERGGTLYLRINDSPAELADNAGSLTVRIKRVK